MAAGPSIIVKLLADASNFKKGVGEAQQSTQGLSSSAKKLVGGLAAGFAAKQVFDFGKTAVAAAEESERATSRLDAVFKSMGDTTGTASKEAQNYAAALSKKIAVDDEAIMAAQAQLATFGAVSDETARSAGIFDRATAAAADLAAAGFGTLDGNAVQLGKALQDPVKGLAALGKSGVTFTEAQKKQIKAMVEAGDSLGAQKIVLGAVEDQVKGTAEATVTGSDRMALAFGEITEAVGTFLLPIMDALAKALTDYVFPAFEAVGNWIKDNKDVVAALGIALGAVGIAIMVSLVPAFLAWASAAAAAAISTLAAIAPFLIIGAVVAVIALLIIKHWDKIKAAASAVWQFVQKAWDKILAAIQAVWEWIKRNWPLLLSILLGPIGAAVALIIKNWDKLKGAVSAVVRFVQDKFQGMVNFISGLVGAISRTIGRIVDAIKGPINAVLRAWNGLGLPGFSIDKELPGPIPDIHFRFPGLDFPNIPLLGAGGIVTGPTLAVLGERGAEAVIPLRSGAMGTTYNLTINAGAGSDPAAIERLVMSSIRRHERRNGKARVR